MTATHKDVSGSNGQLAFELPPAEDEGDGGRLLASYFRLRTPCTECPLRKSQQDLLPPGEGEAIIAELLAHDFSTRLCQRVVRFREYALSNKKGTHFSSDSDAMCAGAAAFLLKRRRPTLGMGIALATRTVPPDHWDEGRPLVVD